MACTSYFASSATGIGQSLTHENHSAWPVLAAPLAAAMNAPVTASAQSLKAGTGDGQDRTRRLVKTFPGTADQVQLARRFVAEVLTGLAAMDDAVLCVSEIASNAIVHSRSSREGGSFTIRVLVEDEVVRVECADLGGAWDDRREPDRLLGGRGLVIVAALAADWGIAETGAGRAVWFRI